MLVIKGKRAIESFKKILVALEKTCMANDGNKNIELVVSDDYIMLKNSNDYTTVENIFYISKEFFYEYEVNGQRNLRLNLGDIKGLINTRKVDKIVIDGNVFKFYDCSGEPLYTAELQEVEKKKKQEDKYITFDYFFDSLGTDYEDENLRNTHEFLKRF